MKTKPDPKVIYEKYINGDSLTDEEVKFGAKYYRDLADRLIKCGPTFVLAFKEANRIYMQMENFDQARKSN